jgi:hypothetical protein
LAGLQCSKLRFERGNPLVELLSQLIDLLLNLLRLIRGLRRGLPRREKRRSNTCRTRAIYRSHTSS